MAQKKWGGPNLPNLPINGAHDDAHIEKHKKFAMRDSDGRASGRALKPARPKPFLASPARPRPEGDKPESPRALADKLGNPILVETML